MADDTLKGKISIFLISGIFEKFLNHNSVLSGFETWSAELDCLSSRLVTPIFLE